MKRVLVGMTVVAASLFVPATTAGAVNNCPGGQIGPNATVNDNVVVAGGTTCLITDSTVNGSVTVEPGGSLELVRTKVTGSVVATQAADLDTRGGSIGTWLSINGSSPGGDGIFAICGTNVGGSVSIQNVAHSDVALGDNDPGEFECPLGSKSVIGGSLNIANNSTDVDVEATADARHKVAGHLSVSGNSRDIDVNNTDFGGGGTVVNNVTTEGVTLVDNSFGRTLHCTGNVPDPQGSGNTAPAKTGQCATL